MKLRDLLRITATFLIAASACALQAQATGEKNQLHIHLEIVSPPADHSDQKATKPQPPLRAAVWLEPIDSTVKIIPPSASSAENFTIIQKNKSFHPDFLVVPVGSYISFPNQDPFFHNVFSLFNGKRFDLGLYEEVSTRSVLFNRVGVSYVFCNIHPQMNAMIIAVDSPYYALFHGDEDAVISGALPGRYRVKLWVAGASVQELHRLEKVVEITDQTTSLGTFRVVVTQDISTTHTNKFGLPYSPYSPATY